MGKLIIASLAVAVIIVYRTPTGRRLLDEAAEVVRHDCRWAKTVLLGQIRQAFFPARPDTIA